jgi:hypothetical protein
MAGMIAGLPPEAKPRVAALLHHREARGRTEALARRLARRLEAMLFHTLRLRDLTFQCERARD